MTLGDLKKSRQKHQTLTTIFGVLSGVFLISFVVCRYILSINEELGLTLSLLRMFSFILFLTFLILACVYGYYLSQDQKKIELVEDKGIPADKVDYYLDKKREIQKDANEQLLQKDVKDKTKEMLERRGYQYTGTIEDEIFNERNRKE
ncbi:MAG: hypothetical protein LUD22_01705 [Coprobacillus sp.]|nr:hypothetical protein [Coprobacillus sp.]